MYAIPQLLQKTTITWLRVLFLASNVVRFMWLLSSNSVTNVTWLIFRFRAVRSTFVFSPNSVMVVNYPDIRFKGRNGGVLISHVYSSTDSLAHTSAVRGTSVIERSTRLKFMVTTENRKACRTVPKVVLKSQKRLKYRRAKRRIGRLVSLTSLKMKT